MSETALTWLVSRGGAVIRDFQASTGLDRVQVSAQEKEVILLGTGDAVKAGSRYLFERGVEKELPMSPVQIQYLLKDKGAKIQEMEAATGLGAIDLDREEV